MKQSPPPATTPLLSVKDIQERYGLGDDLVTRWIRSGELRAFKLGVAWRIHPDDWDEFIDGRRGVAS